MSEIGVGLEPLERLKRTDFESTGDMHLYEYTLSQLTAEQREKLKNRAEFVFVFGVHGTEPENFLAVEKVFDHIDPDDSIICFENAGFSLWKEKNVREEAANAKTSERMRRQREAVLKSRNSVGSNYMTATNAFYYAQEFCLANGFDVYFADIDRWTEKHLINAFGADSFEYDPIQGYDVLAEEWKNKSLTDAVETWKHHTNTSTVLIDKGDDEPIVIPRWGRYQGIREEYVVDRVIALALKKIDQSATKSDEKLKIVTFFGSAHTRGIQQRFSERGIGVRTIQTHLRPTYAVAEDINISMQDVRSFMSSWTSFQLYRYLSPNTQPARSDQTNTISFDDQVEATKRAIELMPTDSLFELYEAFRSAINYYEKPVEENETPLAKAIREFKSARVNPSSILQKLLLEAMHKNGMPLEQATQQYVDERSRARAELFGQQT